MKTRFPFFVIFFFAILSVRAQVSLPDSPKGSAELYVYTISRDNLRKIHLKDEDVSENMLNKQIAKYEKWQKPLLEERGNYVIVEAVENGLVCTEYIVDDLYFKIVSAEKMMLFLHDSSGNIISDAIVKCGSKTLKFDRKTQTYNTSKVKDEQVIEINNKGVYHYVEIENNYYKRTSESAWEKTKRLWRNIKGEAHYIFNPTERPAKNKHIGFVVFNKPKYKPNETIKLKAYMANKNGKPYNKPINIQLYNYFHKTDTILAKNIYPYRPGMYEYQFSLTDSLNLKLDSYYTIALNTNSKRDKEISGRFAYEDYELKSIRFSITTDKKEYAKGDSVNIKLKVTDENEMAMYGGRAEIYVIPDRLYKNTNKEVVFIPDTLWVHSVDMNDKSEKTITIPDSIFPQDASFYYRVNCTYLSADNEKKTESKGLYRNSNDYGIDFSLSKGMLTIKQLHKRESQEVKAEISINGEDDKIILFDTVMLPCTIPATWYATDITVKTKQTEAYYSFNNAEAYEQLGHKFYRTNDSVYLKVDNPAKIPFWYTVRKGKQEIASGYTTVLDYATPNNGKAGYNMQLSYLFGEDSKSIERSLSYIQKNITLDVFTPTTVYPGQKANVMLSVTNKKGEPVKDVDITAYSFTSKFNNNSMPSIPIKAKTRSAKFYKNIEYVGDKLDFVKANGEMTWDTWKKTMALDTIEYYKFLYPDTFYKYTEETTDGSTQILPYFVIDGVLQGISMLWIDETLYYTNLAQQMDIYTFMVSPGKHNLKVRTYDREIMVRGVYVEKGTKNIMSFNAAKAYTGIDSANIITSTLLDKKERGTLSDKEVNLLSANLITIDNNFGGLNLPNKGITFDIPAYICSGNTTYYLNHTTRSTYNRNLRASVNSPILVGPFPTRNLDGTASVYADNKLISNIYVEGKNKYTLYNNYQKIKSWGTLPFSKKLSKYNTPTTDFKQKILIPHLIDQLFDKNLKETLALLTGSAIVTNRKKDTSCLNLSLGKDKKGKYITPSLILIHTEKEDEIANSKLYYGGTRKFFNLPQGKLNLTLILNDSMSYTKNIILRPNGNNYLSIDSIEYEKNTELATNAFELLKRNIKHTHMQNPYIQNHSVPNGYFSDLEEIFDEQEVVVVGRGVQRIAGYINVTERMAGVTGMRRGVSTSQNQTSPFIIVNGLPFYGKLEDIDVESITNFNILKEASATAIYGAKGANGVIVIQTNAVSLAKPADSETDSEIIEAGNSMRRNFHDDAFWQPRLKTNEKGEALFEVTYPDDITSWNAFFTAIGNKNQTDQKMMTIQSFKTLTARLSMPLFAIRGDSLNAVGRVANHLGDSINVKREIEISKQVKTDNITIGYSYVDYIPAKAEKGDSLSIAYSLQMQNGYFDGEERSIPIFEQGMLQTYGDFKAINDSLTHQLKIDPLLGPTTIYAETSGLELFLREIDKVDKYPYMCNEQMASKIKVLLSKKNIAKIFGKEFKDDNKIKNLISRLNKNKNDEGLWGWWNKDKTELWISKQVISAMLDAENAGYKTNLDKQKLSLDLEQYLKDALQEIKYTHINYLPFTKQELLDRLIFLKRMNMSIDYQAYFKSIDSQLKSITTTDKLKTMHVMSLIGLHKEICADSLMLYANTTTLGSMYWGDIIEKDNFFRMPMLPHKNNVENTLIAYNILRNMGGHEEKLIKIRNYFFEIRRGSWQNTYESSRIIETIMPDMLNANNLFVETSMYINGKQITKFPYSDNIETTEPIEIKKEGTLPLFVTAYQQAWNKQPDSETEKGFSVKSYFVANKDTISYLTAGKTAQLEVLVNISSDANYVQIEIPIPAGCSYENKTRGFYWNEVHREHFKDKVVIFSNKLSKGEHKFSIDLLARYSGKYYLNPAKVELMYFPTFYGNEKLKTVDVQ